MQIQHVRSISVRRIVRSTGLAALISIAAIGSAFLGTRYAPAPQARIPAAPPARSAQFGISRPVGVDVRELPAGYSDYFLPESDNVAAKPSSMQLGIARPAGVDMRELPAGYTDYFLPESGRAAQPASMWLGLARPAWVDVRTWPAGYSD